MSILIFLLVLFVLILVHELGHFLVAKWVGMRVDEFGIGFPPKLFGIKKGETEYTFNIFPIGGFVKIYGEDGADGEVDRSRAFVGKNKWAQAAVLVAGVTFNVLFAWMLFTFAITHGIQTAVPEDVASENAQLIVADVMEGSPAAEAGLTRGAVITGIEGDAMLTPISFRDAVSDSGAEVTVQYTIGGSEFTADIIPATGLVEDDPDRLAVGVALSLVDVVSQPVHIAAYEALILTGTGLRDVTIGIGTLLVDALSFNADLSQVAGPVGIVGLVGEASAFGLTALLMFTAFISLNLAVINLFPFPALDGGRLLFVIIEAIKGSAIKPGLAYALNAAGFVILILLMIAITYNDILRLL